MGNLPPCDWAWRMFHGPKTFLSERQPSPFCTWISHWFGITAYAMNIAKNTYTAPAAASPHDSGLPTGRFFPYATAIAIMTTRTMTEKMKAWLKPGQLRMSMASIALSCPFFASSFCRSDLVYADFVKLLTHY